MRKKTILLTLLISVLSLTIICYFQNKDLILDTFTDYSPTNEIFLSPRLITVLNFQIYPLLHQIHREICMPLTIIVTRLLKLIPMVI